MTITPIGSIHDILDYAEGEGGIAAFDLDDTLGRMPLIASTRMDKLLAKMNQLMGYEPYTHNEWFYHLFKTLPFQPCEPAHGVNSLVKELRERNWRVCIVTARSSTHRELALKHIWEAGLPFKDHELICCGVASKKDKLKGWIGMDSSDCTLFVDDQHRKCEDVAQMGNAQVFHYQPDNLLSDEDFSAAVTMQLAALKTGEEELPLERAYTSSEEQNALQQLEIDELTLKNIHGAFREVAAAAGYEFKKATADVPESHS